MTPWPTVTLESLSAPFRGAITDGPFGSNLTSAHYTEAGPQVVRLQNIGDGVYNQAPAHISEEHFESLRKHEVLAGDLLVASLGQQLPRACLMPETVGPAIVKADCIRVRLKRDVDPRWVMYALQRLEARRWAEQHLHGVGRPRLGLKLIRQIPVPLPSLDVQRYVVDALEEHLSHLDHVHRALRRVMQGTTSLTRSLLCELIPEPDRYGEGWASMTVADAGLVQLGRQRHPDWHSGPNMRPYLRVANVFESRIDASDLMEMHWPDDTFEHFKLQPGDILLNEGQSPQFLGRPALYAGDPANVAFTNSLIRFRAREDVLPEFAMLVFRRHMHAGRFMRESRITTNIAHLSASRFKKVEFPIPPISTQRRIVAVAEERLASVARLQAEVVGAEERGRLLRRSLLSAAYSARLTRGASDIDQVVEEAETGLEGLAG